MAVAKKPNQAKSKASKPAAKKPIAPDDGSNSGLNKSRKIKQLSREINKIDQWVLARDGLEISRRTQSRILAKLKIRKKLQDEVNALQNELNAFNESNELEFAAKRRLAMERRAQREALYYKLSKPKKIIPSDDLLWRASQILNESEPLVKNLAFELFSIDTSLFNGIQGLKVAIYREHFSLGGGNRISEDKGLAKRRQTLLCALTALRAAIESKKYILLNNDLAWHFLAIAERNFGVAKGLSWNGIDMLITSSQRKGGKGRHQQSIQGQSLALIKDEWLKIPEVTRMDKKFNKSEWARSQIPVMKGDVTERAVLTNIRKWNQGVRPQ